MSVSIGSNHVESPAVGPGRALSTGVAEVVAGERHGPPTGLSCPACEHVSPWRVHQELPGGRVVACERCGLGASSPVPVAATAPAEYYARMPEEEARRKLPMTQRYAGPILDFIQRRVPSGRLLDIGCGIGGILSVARDRGYDVEGLELNPESVQFCRDLLDLQVHQTTLDAARLPAGRYDVVVANHVFEHLVNIGQALDQVISLLRPGGLFLLVSPHYQGWVARQQRDRWYGYQIQEHVWHFSLESAGRFFGRAGFEKIEVTAPVNMDHPIHRGLKAPLKAALLGLSRLTGHADQVFACGRRPEARADSRRDTRILPEFGS